jgi:hypothetical protein
MSIIKQIQTLSRKLQTAYENGQIGYPRVAHNYINLKDLKFYEMPHPPLKTFDENSKPLQQDSYILDKKTLPLWLTHTNIATPATLVRNCTFVDKFVNDAFELRDFFYDEDLEEKLENLIEELRNNSTVIYQSDIATEVFKENEIKIEDDEDLLHYIASDGIIAQQFKVEITPYSIILNPTAYQEQLLSKNDNNDEDKDEIIEKDKETKKIFKILNSPTSNYTEEVTQKSIKLKNIDALKPIQNKQKTYKEINKKIDKYDKKANKLAILDAIK